MARTSDYVVCFRFPGDDWFMHRETNIHAKDKREAFDLAKARFPEIELLEVFQGLVMLYGAPYCTIDESIPRYKQTKPITFKHESRRRA